MNDRTEALLAGAARRILVVDGAMGTMVQREKLAEDAYRGDRFQHWNRDLKGNADVLNLTQPALVRKIHAAYLDAGADVLETNTFNATSIAQVDYAMEAHVRAINRAGAELARAAADAKTAETPDRPRFVAGTLGPTNRTASLSPDVNNPGMRNIDFDSLRAAYAVAVAGLIEGGADVLLVETIFDTLNAKAALFAIDETLERLGRAMPVMISGTITDASGRTLSGQTTEAFWYSVRHANPYSVGLNCALGAEMMRPFLTDLSRVADTLVSAHPNAGLPNAFGAYDETPDEMASHLGAWARDGLVNLVGGCCGTTPEHIQAIAEAVEGVAPRPVPETPAAMRLSGLEPFILAGAGA